MVKRGNTGPTGDSPAEKQSVIEALLDSQLGEAGQHLPLMPPFPGSTSSANAGQNLVATPTNLVATPQDPMVQQLQSLMEMQQRQMEQNQLMMQSFLQAFAQSNEVPATTAANDAAPSTTPMEEDGKLGVKTGPIEVVHVKSAQIPNVLANHIKTIAKEHRQQVESIKKTEERLVKLKANSVQLSNGKVATGLPPFKMPFKAKYMEETCYTDEDKLTFEFSSAAGESYVQCKHRLYVEYLAMQNEIDIRLSERTKTNLLATVNLEKFISSCKEPLVKHKNAVGEVCTFLGQDVQYDDTIEALLEAEATKAFKGILNSVAAARLKTKEDKERLVELERLQRETAAKLSPGTVFETYVADIVDKKLKGKKAAPQTNVDFGAMLKLEVSTPVYESDEAAKTRQLQKHQLEELKRLKHEMKTKNSQSPAAVGGSNRPQPKAPKPKPKAKAGGKAKGGAKGSGSAEKGAGKGKDKAKSSKGKGRGKGK